jgi:serine/threonine protein kinase
MSGKNDGVGADALGQAATVVDTRPTGDVKALESARTVAVTPFESGRTLAAATPFESARTAAVTPPPGEERAAGSVALRPFGPYSQVETLGQQGNMGVVARGYNQAFGRWELLKFLRPELSHDAELLRQFRREGRALARLSHPNVVQVFAMYDLDAQPCIAMEFLDGLSLTAELEQSGGQLSQDRAQELLLDAARGLAAAHELGLLHRDIKPDNLFVTLPGKGRVAGLKLIDFGLATADKARPEELQKDPSLASNATGGTPLFLAPELWQGKDPTPLTDLYALGVSFYFALTGEFPPKHTALSSVIAYAGNTSPAPRVGAARPELSAAFAALIDRLIDKDPRRRLESAEKLVAELVAQRSAARPRRVPGAGPYRGLSAFSESERDVFFGREREIAEITERLRTQLGLLLVGPVASGKTSLARAGIVPAIRDGVLGGGHTFDAVLLEPRGEPLRGLCAALAPSLPMPENELWSELSAAPGELRALIERRLAPSRGLVLVVDQLEQLADAAPDDALRFARALSSLLEVESPRLRLLATARSDVVDRLFRLEPLRSLLTRGFHPVAALAAEDLQRALAQPAKVAGFTCEDPAMLVAVATSAEGCAAPLCLASLALQRLWQLRDESRRVFPLAAWEKLGGAVGALLEHADAVWQSLGAAERSAAGDVVLRLISTRGGRVSARRESLADPAGGGEAAARALERLLASRLCVEIAGEIELLHEALATTWSVAQELLERVGVDQQLRQRVTLAAQQWKEQNEPEGLLWAGEQAERLLTWFAGAEQSFTLLELEFVAAVRKQTLRKRRLKQVGIVAGALGLVAICSWLVVRDRRLGDELARTRERAAQAAERHARQSARLFADRAALRLQDFPAGALADAQASGKLRKSPELDVTAWHALALGVPFGLPLHAGGASAVASNGEFVVTAGADGVHALRIVGSGAAVAPLRAVTSIALSDQAWLATAEGAIYRARYRLPEGKPQASLDPMLVGKGPGSVRELLVREKRGLVLAVRRDGAQLSLQAVHSGAPQLIWAGAALDLAVDAEGARFAAITHEGEIKIGRTDTPSEPTTRVSHRSTCVGWLGDRLVLGDVGGLVQFGDDEPSLAFDLKMPVARLHAAASGQALIAESSSGPAILLSPTLTELGRVQLGSPALRFLEPWRAVALVDEQQNVRVLSYDTGLTLARFRGSGSRLTALSASESWLFTTAQDGAVRAFPLTTSLPKPFAPPARPPLASAISALGTVVALDAETVTLRSNQPGAALSTPVTPELRPAPSARLTSGAGVAWLHDATTFAVWNRKQLASGQAPRPVQSLFALPGSPDLLLVLAGPGETNSQLAHARGTAVDPPGLVLPAPILAFAAIDDAGRVAVLPAQGPLRLVADLGRRADGEVALPPGPRSGALALSADGARFAVGFTAGTLAVGALQKDEPRLYRGSRAPITCLAFGRDERVLVVGDAQGAVMALDLDTDRTFALFSSGTGPIQCGYDSARERFTFLDAQHRAWTLALDTTPLSFIPAVDDPLDPSEHTLARWRGLEPSPTREAR